MYEHSNIKKQNEYNECNISGICSISPILSAIKAAIFAYLQEFAFYISEVRALEARNAKIKNAFIETFSMLISNSEYSEDSLLNIFSKLQDNINEVKTLYKSLCEEKNIQPKFFKSKIKLNKTSGVTEIIKQGTKYSDNFKQRFTEEQIKGYDIVLVILKSICLYIVELQDFNVDIDKYYEELLFAVAHKWAANVSIDELKKIIEKYSKSDNELLTLLFEARKNEFGDFVESEVHISEIEGKAILVAGTNFKELELLLEATKDKGINVYTHGQMITAHSFSKFKSYPHLVGHYGKGADYYVSDFTTFPGSIFLTKLSLFKVENLYYSRIFTFSKIKVQGITTLCDYDFEPLIKSALFADGFLETKPETKIKVGVIEQDYINKIVEFTNKIKDGRIKNIFAIGIPSKIDDQKEYFKQFYTLLKDDCFVISFSYADAFEHSLVYNIDYDFPLLYIALNHFLPLKQEYGLKINVFVTRCEPHTIPNLIYLKYIGVDNIIFSSCSPSLINPALIDSFLKWFDIKLYTTAENDLNIMTNRN